MTEIIFKSLPTIILINANTLRFTPKEDEDISVIKDAVKGDELIIGQSRFILRLSPLITMSRNFGRKLPDSPPPRITEAVVFGQYKPQGKAMYKIFTKPNCPFCVQAKDLFNSRGIPFEEYALDTGQEKITGKSYFTVPQLQAMIPGVRTVPQIFKESSLIGGYDQLKRHLEINSSNI